MQLPTSPVRNSALFVAARSCPENIKLAEPTVLLGEITACAAIGCSAIGMFEGEER